MLMAQLPRVDFSKIPIKPITAIFRSMAKNRNVILLYYQCDFY